MDGDFKATVEALIFAADSPVSVEKIAKILEADMELVRAAVAELTTDYVPRGINLFELAGGYRFLTSRRFYPMVLKMKDTDRSLSLSQAAFETLAIVAYRQPVTSQEIAAMRGVQSVSSILRNLQTLELVRIAGRKDVIGRPMLYRTTPKFLELFGLYSLDELPSLEEIGVNEL
ncbi:MAG: SMC-Scp complex subunit ScpB [Acidobacteria bacterium]|nr:SMC-Scp complex subunit ScpB [Acidobacteriota bacterium]